MSVLRALPALFKVGLAQMFAYRAELIIWFLTSTAPIIALFVWDRVAEAGPIGRFDQESLGSYFVAMLVVRQLTGCWLVWELNEAIRSGEINAQLLKPMSPMWYWAAENLAAHPFRLLVLVPLLTALFLWRPELAFWPGTLTMLLAAVSTGLGWLLMFTMHIAFGSLAFRVQQTMGIFNVWFGMFMLFSGYIFPIELAPLWARDALAWLPFRAMLATPVEIATGLLQPMGALRQMGIQGLWILIWGLIAAVLWRTGLRHHEAVGA